MSISVTQVIMSVYAHNRWNASDSSRWTNIFLVKNLDLLALLSTRTEFSFDNSMPSQADKDVKDFVKWYDECARCWILQGGEPILNSKSDQVLLSDVTSEHQHWSWLSSPEKYSIDRIIHVSLCR